MKQEIRESEDNERGRKERVKNSEKWRIGGERVQKMKERERGEMDN